MFINRTNNSTSNIQTLEDCIIYDSLTSDKGDWYNDGATVAYSDTGLTVSKSTSGEAHYLKTTPVNTPFTYEVTWLAGKEQLFALRLHDLLANANTYCWCYLFSNSWAGIGYTGGSDAYKSGCSISSGSKIKVEVTSTAVKLYVNNNLWVTKSVTTLSEYYIGFYTNNGRSQTVKDMKIKPYSE